MSGNRAVAYIAPGKVEVQTIDYPKLELQDGPGVNPANVGRKCPHGVILKVVSTNICGSDQHMVRGRTTAPEGLVLGHEITGEVIEAGPGVEFIKVGDLCSVPFNIACGRCRNCKERKTGIPHRLPRRVHRRSQNRFHGLHRRGRPGRPGQRALRTVARRGGGHCRRHEPGAAGSGPQLRL